MRRTTLRIFVIVMLLGWWSAISWGSATADVVDTDTETVGLQVTGDDSTPDPRTTPDATPDATPTETATATVPPVTSLPETGAPASHAATTATLLTMMAAGSLMVGGALFASRLRTERT